MPSNAEEPCAGKPHDRSVRELPGNRQSYLDES